MASKLQSGEEDRESERGRHVQESVRRVYENSKRERDSVKMYPGEIIALYINPAIKTQSKLFTECMHSTVYKLRLNSTPGYMLRSSHTIEKKHYIHRNQRGNISCK